MLALQFTKHIKAKNADLRFSIIHPFQNASASVPQFLRNRKERGNVGKLGIKGGMVCLIIIVAGEGRRRRGAAGAEEAGHDLTLQRKMKC
jgi:hypothetical protein